MKPADIPVVILCGGKGARFDHESQVLPKPLIEVAGKPILEHIIDSFVAQGFREFILAVGYLGNKISQWAADVSRPRYTDQPEIRVVDTGHDSHTGERLVRLRNDINNRRFVLTYGDGLANIDMQQLLTQHDWAHMISDCLSHPPAPLVTITAVHPPGRFGMVKMENDYESNVVASFDEKPSDSLINGGYMIIEPQFIDKYLIGDCGTWPLESGALPALASHGTMQAYIHTGYWRCMDTRRDLEQIEADVVANNCKMPWRRD